MLYLTYLGSEKDAKRLVIVGLIILMVGLLFVCLTFVIVGPLALSYVADIYPSPYLSRLGIQ